MGVLKSDHLSSSRCGETSPASTSSIDADVAARGDTVTQDARKVRLRPFIRWAGGKRWLVSRYPGLIEGPTEGVFFEPFLGSAVVFSSIQPEQAVLSDLNPELIATYVAVRDQPDAVVAVLQLHHACHSESYYYATRSSTPESSAEIAGRFLYLNRTCFNGIYRVNQQGRFNVPMGSRENVLRPEDDFVAWSLALEKCELIAEDCEAVIQRASSGDIIYADPPYTVRHNLNSFRKYNESLFSWEDQVRLAVALSDAAQRGVRVVVSNANHSSVSELYPQAFLRKSIARNSSIAASPDKRGAFEELLLWTEGAIDERFFS
jgi:DNA adenine methylase